MLQGFLRQIAIDFLYVLHDGDDHGFVVVVTLQNLVNDLHVKLLHGIAPLASICTAKTPSILILIIQNNQKEINTA